MSEWVIGRLLQVWKRFRKTDELQVAHRFKRSYGRTFSGSTIGIVGLGHIGRAVAARARALGCRTVGLRKSARAGDASLAAVLCVLKTRPPRLVDTDAR